MGNKECKVPPIDPLPPGGIPRLSDDDVYRARRMYNEGYPKREIADAFEVSIPTISNAIHGRGAYQGI